MGAPQPPSALPLPTAGLDAALGAIAAGAAERDARPRFPHEAIELLGRAGALSLTVPDRDGRAAGFAEEWALVRAVAAADASVARILDGHLNAVERLRVAAPAPLRAAELAAVAAGERRLGVWGADPRAGEGPPARLVGDVGEERLVGVKVFCSGAGGLDRALVAARDRDRRRAARLRGPRRAGRGGPKLVPGRRDALLGEPPGALPGCPGAGPAGRAGRARARARVRARRHPHRRDLGRVRRRGGRGGARRPGGGRPAGRAGRPRGRGADGGRGRRSTAGWRARRPAPTPTRRPRWPRSRWSCAWPWPAPAGRSWTRPPARWARAPWPPAAGWSGPGGTST